MKLSKKALKKIALMVTMGLFAASSAYALPSQGTLDNSAAATISADAANGVMNIAGKGQNNIINWASFNIDKGEIVKFNDKNNYLNLVHGVDMSRIYGTISGGNAVYLVNPNGILFAEGAALDNVGGFVASTRNISSINKEAFLNDPSNTTAVLGLDHPVMDNRDYYPEGSLYKPKITMADIQLTNVPDSATLILDGPGGVILKNRDLLNDKITHVITRQIGGELGIGYESGTLVSDLTDAEKNKISLVAGDKYYGKESIIPYPVKWYTHIRNLDELKANGYIGSETMLVNDIDLDGNIEPIDYFNGNLEGLGYSINNIKIYHEGDSVYNDEVGLFKSFEGDGIRNLSLNNLDINLNRKYSTTGSLMAYSRNLHDTATLFNNINVSGKINIDYADVDYWTMHSVGGIIGNTIGETEIRNSSSNVEIYVHSARGTDIGGIIGDGSQDKIYNSINKGNITFSQVEGGGSSNWSTYIGGISAAGGATFLGCENYGDIHFENTSDFRRKYFIGGIVGESGADINLGDCYSLGNIILNYPNYIDSHEINVFVGGLYAGLNGNVITSSITGNKLPSYYIKDNLPVGQHVAVINFGEAKRPDELLLDYNFSAMKGVHDFSTKHELPKPPAPEPNPNPNPNPDGGNTGSGTTNPPSGGNTGSGTTNPPSGGNTGSGTTNPPSGGNTGSGTTNPPSDGNTGSGTTNPPSGGNTGSGTTNPPSGGNTSEEIKDPTDSDFEYGAWDAFRDTLKDIPKNWTLFWDNIWKPDEKKNKTKEIQNKAQKLLEEYKKGGDTVTTKEIINSSILNEISNEKIKKKIAEILVEEIHDSINNPVRLNPVTHPEEKVEDGNITYYITGNLFTEDGTIYGDITISTVNQDDQKINIHYEHSESVNILKSEMKKYSEEAVQNVIDSCVDDIAGVVDAIVNPSVAYQLFEKSGATSIVETYIKEQKKGEPATKDNKQKYASEALANFLETTLKVPNIIASIAGIK